MLRTLIRDSLPVASDICDSPPTGEEFRNKFGKLRVTPKDKNLPAEEYLVGLIKAMIGEDQDLVGLNNARTNIGASECMRNLPSISSAYTNTKAVALKAELAQHLCVLVTPKDDPVYLQLHDKYLGCILLTTKPVHRKNCSGSSQSNTYNPSLLADSLAGRQRASRFTVTQVRESSLSRQNC